MSEWIDEGGERVSEGLVCCWLLGVEGGGRRWECGGWRVWGVLKWEERG